MTDAKPQAFTANCRNNDEHQIGQVVGKPRAMMPWIAKGKMVDTSRN